MTLAEVQKMTTLEAFNLLEETKFEIQMLTSFLESGDAGSEGPEFYERRAALVREQNLLTMKLQEAAR